MEAVCESRMIGLEAEARICAKVLRVVAELEGPPTEGWRAAAMAGRLAEKRMRKL